MEDPKKQHRCKVCEKRTREECGRVVCGNRRRETAKIADGAGALGEGRYVRRPMKRGLSV